MYYTQVVYLQVVCLNSSIGTHSNRMFIIVAVWSLCHCVSESAQCVAGTGSSSSKEVTSTQTTTFNNSRVKNLEPDTDHVTSGVL